MNNTCAIRRLIDCVDVADETPQPFVGEKRYVSTGAVDDKKINEEKVEKITYENRPSRANLTAKPGDVLFAKMQATSKMLLLSKETAENIYSTGFFAIRGKEGILLPEYLFHLMSSEQILRQKDRNCTGATQKSLTLEGLSKIIIACPALSCQATRASILGKLNELIANYQCQQNLIKDLQESYFDEHFGEGCHHPREPLEQNVEEMFIGPFGSALKNEAFVSAQDAFCMVYEQKHAIRGTMEVETRYVNKAKHDALKRFEVHGGDIIVSCRGTIGKTFVVPPSAPMGIMHPSIMKLRLRKDKYNPIFFERLLRRYFAREEAKANGSGVKMAVTATILGKVSFIRPPLSEQLRFVSLIEQMDKTKQSLNEALQTAKTLQEALEQRYFNTEACVNS